MVNANSLFDLRNKVALVTGASSGLGRRAAIVLSAAGAKVIGVARRRDALEELRKEIGNKFKIDMSDVLFENIFPEENENQIKEEMEKFKEFKDLLEFK